MHEMSPLTVLAVVVFFGVIVHDNLAPTLDRLGRSWAISRLAKHGSKALAAFAPSKGSTHVPPQ
jgi:hypothetical protein